jgi:23S rRNA-/tRNA-specific pseudouridylate synthase
VHKTYHAIINGLPGWDEHDARHSLRVNVGHTHRTVVDHRRGKSSLTVFHVLERYPNHSLLEAHPLSGRTHQVRVHAYALGFPLLGDTLYSAPPTDLIARPALHALSMEFIFEGNLLRFEAPYPLDLTEAIKKLRAG